MKTQTLVKYQIHAYSEKIAEQIAERIRKMIANSDVSVEDWTGIDQDFPPCPEVYIFFDMEEECEINDDGIPTEIANAINGENVLVWRENTLVLHSILPKSVEQHVEWLGVPVEEYQHIYPARKSYPQTEEYKCSDPKCKNQDTWYSLPDSFVELTRPECPSCNKIGQKIS
jgi:hypothetical protein